MFAVAFDLEVAAAEKAHPRTVRQAYLDIEASLSRFGFRRIQGSVFVTESEDLANLFRAISALKSLTWLPQSVRDIRAFRVEQWSDFTAFIKE
jgi:virulence-associated protein VapD